MNLCLLRASGYLLPSELFIDIEPTFRFLPSSTSVCIGELALKVVDEAHVYTMRASSTAIKAS
ncbi:uncharacterized protein PGTG_12055 [Puccinia graminis f. sp. tritici CRL 75-36-700-3]|uniref:Uncharacterized protein n=1 Tax=Puccinia graminis f. sp. tritici (strain CRL 75-36-700-3 / race SCCL) TaxID=418459 RepID=E3KP74_PUCGT|nr:uncharacterized protein PGTG_12055 [Puccinia graminis f. sp. tritici CRL 75-36-700-3]EFP86099.2 hypothetical protein PGTG_12055 [Puccinia graminis f. sp. tritici CRL 75-36-700-3]